MADWDLIIDYVDKLKQTHPQKKQWAVNYEKAEKRENENI